MSLRAISGVSVATLFVVAAACSDSVTQPQSGAAPQESAPSVSAAGGPPPTLVMTTTPGWGGPPPPPGFAAPSVPTFTLTVRGTGFPKTSSWKEEIWVILSDGTRTGLGAGSGRDPDGGVRASASAECRVGYVEAWDVVTYGGQRVESNHVVPAC